jgi:hypothetical protein
MSYNELSLNDIKDIGETIIEMIDDLENETLDLGSMKTILADLAQELIDNANH